MALKIYNWRGFKWQYEESEAPEGAVEVKAEDAPPANKARRAPANKARGAQAKRKK